MPKKSIQDDEKNDEKEYDKESEEKTDLKAGKIVSPYIVTELEQRVVLTPDKLNENRYKNLKKRLKEIVLGKCSKYGYIAKVHKITEEDDGLIIAEDLSRSVTHEITYKCTVCNPTVGTSIVAKVSTINDAVIKAVNGPIIILINPKQGRFNSEQFKLGSSSILIKKEDNMYLSKKDYVIVKVLGIKFMPDDTSILTLGYIERLATKREKVKFLDDVSVIESKFVKLDKVNQTE